jgi:hypothetical protein
MKNRPASVVFKGLTMPIARLVSGQDTEPRSLRFAVRGSHLSCSLLVLLTTLMTLPVSAADQKTVADLTSKSGYIFLGTVRQTHAATPTVPLEPTTAIVLVDRVLDGVKEIGDLKGKEVTVRLVPREKVERGKPLVFFTYGYSFGKSVGLAEVGSLPAEEAEALSKQVREARQTSADQAVQRRLETAELVVLATAGEPRPTEDVRRPDVDEHDALWWVASLKVEKTLKGAVDGDTVSVLFARNTDYRWFRSPKIHAGEHAIYLLHRDQDREHGMKGFFVVDKSDVVPAEDLERIQRLLKTAK